MGFKRHMRILNEAISVEASLWKSQLENLNEDFLLKLEASKNMMKLSLQKESAESEERMNKNKLEQMSALEESNLCFTARLSELSEMIGLEQKTHQQAIEEQIELLKQVQESLNVEKIKRCAMEESSQALMAEHRAAQETSAQHVMGLIHHERDERCYEAVIFEERIKEISNTFLMELSTKLLAVDVSMKDLRSSFQQQLNECQESTQNYFEKLASAQETALSANMNNTMLSLRLDLDNEARLRDDSVHSLKNEIGTNYNKNLEAFASEASHRKADIYCQQLGLQDLCKKFDAFREETNDVTQRLWNSIDMHTHDVCVDEFLKKAHLNRVDKECQTSVVRSISPYAVRVLAGTGASAIPVNRVVTSKNQIFSKQPTTETLGHSQFLRPALQTPMYLSDSRYLNTRSTLP